MKKLIYKLGLFFFLVSFVIICSFFITGMMTTNHRLGTTYIKQDRLSSIKQNKIILIGGSNLHYGMNSELLEKELGLNVVNMGIQGSIGMAYYFNEIIDQVKKNDIVIFLAEPAHFGMVSKDGQQTLYNLISKYPQGVKYLNTNQIVSSPKKLGVAIQENISYLLTLFVLKINNKKTILEKTNHWGDYEGHKGRGSVYQSKPKDYSFDMEVLKKGITQSILDLQEMEKIIKSKDAHLLIGFAPIAKSAAYDDVLQIIDAEVAATFHPTTLGSFTKYILPDEKFYDTHHHLIYDMRDRRTQMLIENIMENETTASLIKTVSNQY